VFWRRYYKILRNSGRRQQHGAIFCQSSADITALQGLPHSHISSVGNSKVEDDCENKSEPLLITNTNTTCTNTGGLSASAKSD
jgi:hypothetical protein